MKGQDEDNEMSLRLKKIGGDETIAEANILKSSAKTWPSANLWT